jgi:hypothetical protein
LGDELGFLREISTPLAEGARRGLLIGEARDLDSPEAPCLLILDRAWNVESVTPGVERWLDELPDGDWQRSGRRPTAILAVAGQALRKSELPASPGEMAVSRVLSRAGPHASRRC